MPSDVVRPHSPVLFLVSVRGPATRMMIMRLTIIRINGAVEGVLLRRGALLAVVVQEASMTGIEIRK